jgi:hypothetical protein
MRVKIIVVFLAVAGLWFFFDTRPIHGQADCSIDGTYQSDWGPVNLQQSENKVTGTWQKGTISGVRNGNVIRYTWYEGPVPGGRGTWRISPNCANLRGPWGSGSSSTGGGNWNLHK